MPLIRPVAYIVTYELKAFAFNYGNFFNELKNSDGWFHYIDSTWIVRRRETLVELQAKLNPLVQPGDRLLIMPAKGPAAGWLPSEAWEWLNTHVPREW